MEDNFAPYAAPENVLRVLEKVHANGLRGKIDLPFLTQLGIGESSSSRVLRALEFLGFTSRDDEGVPTPLLEQYVVSGEGDSQALLQEAVRTAYGRILQAANPETDSREKIHTAFKIMRPQSQWKRMVTFFLVISKAAGINVKEPAKDRPGKMESPKARSERNAKKVVAKERPMQEQRLALPSGPSRTLDPALASIVGKVSELETLEDLDAWYAMFKAAFQYVKKVHS